MTIFVKTLLVGISAEAISVLSADGQPGCLCITNQQASSIHNTLGGWLLAASSNASFSYGIGVCTPHDATPPRDPGCNVSNPPSWCLFDWCYVQSTCSVERYQSTVRLGLFYSYSTCGYLDSRYNSANLLSALVGAPVRVAYMTNTGGWRGSYCTPGAGCTGSSAEFVQWMLNEAGAQKVVIAKFYEGPLTKYPSVFPPAVMHAVLRDNPNQTSTFDACAYATGMGYIDVCIGSFAQTILRLEATEFFTLSSRQLILVAKTRGGQVDWIEVMLKAFKPFQAATWVAIISVILLISICIALTEASEEGLYCQWSFLVSMIHASYTGLRSFVGGGNEHDPVHPAACMSSLGLGFFLLLTISAYTANLASILIVKNTAVATVSSWQEVLDDPSINVCGHLANEALVVRKGLARTRYIKGGNRAASLNMIGSDTCKVGVAFQEDLERMQEDTDDCSFVKVGDPLASINTGVPVSRKLGRALQLLAVKGQREGKWAEFVDKYRPGEVCKAKLAKEAAELQEQGMTVKDMLGPITISGMFCVFGLIFLVIERAIPRVRKFRVSFQENTQPQLDSATDVSNSATEVPQEIGQVIEDIMSRQMQNMMQKEDIDHHMKHMMQQFGDLKRELRDLTQIKRV